MCRPHGKVSVPCNLRIHRVKEIVILNLQIIRKLIQAYGIQFEVIQSFIEFTFCSISLNNSESNRNTYELYILSNSLVIFKINLVSKYRSKQLSQRELVTKGRIANGGGFEDEKREPDEYKRQYYREHQQEQYQRAAREPPCRRTSSASFTYCSAGTRYGDSLNPRSRYVKLHFSHCVSTSINPIE